MKAPLWDPHPSSLHAGSSIANHQAVINRKERDMASSTHHRTDTNTSSRSRTGEDAGVGSDRPVGIDQIDETDETNLGEGVMNLLNKVGFDEQTVQATVAQWRSQLGSNVSRQIEEADLLDLLDKARDLARTSATRIKSSAQTKPSLFYGGVLALIAGAGLLVSAARQ